MRPPFYQSTGDALILDYNKAHMTVLGAAYILSALLASPP